MIQVNEQATWLLGCPYFSHWLWYCQVNQNLFCSSILSWIIANNLYLATNSTMRVDFATLAMFKIHDFKHMMS